MNRFYHENKMKMREDEVKNEFMDAQSRPFFEHRVLDYPYTF